jgi:flagellar biosynthesis/type III secretory pathway protein FliH
VGTVIKDKQQRNPERPPHWDRLERADLFEQYQALRTQGISERQAAKELKVPRTTLQAWRIWHDTLDICPHIAAFFQSGPGLAFLHRLVIAFHLVCVEVGACGIRLVCLFLNLTGLNRFVAASYGAQQQVNLQVEQAMVTYRHEETARLAQDMSHKDLTVTQDETFTGGLCLITMDPESNFIILEQLAQTRDQVMWNDLMAPALAQLNCRVIQSTSDEAPGLLAYVEHYLEAHHSPDLFHVQHELVKAVSGPMATKEREAYKAVTEAREQLERLSIDPQSAGDEPAKRRPGRPPKEPVRLEQAEQALEAASREHERLAQQREQVKASLRGIGHAYHFVDLERGVRRNGKLIAGDIQVHIDTIRTIAQQEHLSETCLDRIAKAERVVPKMQATIEFVSGYVRQQVRQLDVAPPASYAMHAKLIPSYYLDRVAQTRSVSDGEPLRELAERLRAPSLAPGGALSALSPEALAQLHDEAKRLATVFQRSSSNVEGRNGYLSLRSHQLRGLDLPRKRECFTTIHNFFLTRPDGTTAAERFFGQKPRSMFTAILESVELAPAPLSPPRKA